MMSSFGSIASVASWRPTTAGIPERTRHYHGVAGLPSAIEDKGQHAPLSILAVSEGAISSATITRSSLKLRTLAKALPIKVCKRRRATSRISAARSFRYSSSMLSKINVALSDHLETVLDVETCFSKLADHLIDQGLVLEHHLVCIKNLRFGLTQARCNLDAHLADLRRVSTKASSKRLSSPSTSCSSML